MEQDGLHELFPCFLDCFMFHTCLLFLTLEKPVILLQFHIAGGFKPTSNVFHNFLSAHSRLLNNV